MNRRAFNRLASSALAGLAVPSALEGRMASLPQQALRVDGDRLVRRMGALARFGANEAGGIDRVAFSDANLEARDWVMGLMDDAGLTVSVDPVGNIIGARTGSDTSLPPLMLGSHIDSVPGGGNFDGQLGSMAALEVAKTLSDAGASTRHPLEFVIFFNEEGGKTGSRAMAGEVEPREMDLPTASGFTIGQGISRLGGDPDRLHEARRDVGSLTAFLELHIEQGAILDTDGIQIGVVEGIVGIRRWNVTITGTTNHAGTTPMDRRRDALVAAARFIDMVHRTALELPGRHVATVGRLEVEPGAPNVIPGRVVCSLEIRDLSMEGIETVFSAIRQRGEEIASGTGTDFAFDPFYLSRAAPTDPRIRDAVEAAAQGLGHSTLRMPSGAGHDAQSVALLAPVGMIFVPSVDGISHAPEEFTPPADVVRGADVLLQTLLSLDASGLG